MPAQLEDLSPGVLVHGIVAGQAVSVVAAEWHGQSAVTLTYRTGDGDVAQRLVYRADETALGIERGDGGWKFDADGELFRLAAEAHRLRLAYLFDPRLAVYLSLLEPLPWYRDHGFDGGLFGDAETLFKTTNTSLDGLEAAGFVRSRAGALRSRDRLPDEWTPVGDRLVTVWEVAQHLVKRLNAAGEGPAAELLRQCRQWADEARSLAYWLSLTAVAKGRTAEVLDYDALVTSWSELARRAEEEPAELSVDGQGRLLQ